MIERLKFLRRTAHVASMIAPLAVAVAILSATQTSQPAKAPKGPDASKKPPAADTQKGQSASTNQQPAIPPINVTVTAPQKSAKELDAERQQRERETAIQEAISKFNGWLVVVGFMQVVAMAFGLLYTVRAANAAKKSADTAEQTLHLTQRAFVDIRNWGLIATIGSKPRLTCQIVNTGHTVAKNVRMEGDVQIRTVPLPDIPVWPGYKDSGPGQVIGQNGIRTSTVDGDDILTQEAMTQLNNGTPHRLYAWGRVRYEDVFNKTQYTSFAFWWDQQAQSIRFDAPQAYYYAT